MPIGHGEEAKTRLTVSKTSQRETFKSPSPTGSRSPSTTPRKSTSTSLQVPRSAPNTKPNSDFSPQVNKATAKMAQAKADRALMKFMTITDRVGQFEARVNTPTDTIPSIHTSRVRLEQIRALWDKVEKEYEACSEALSGLGSTDTITVMQSKYDYCYAVYERCAASLNEIIEEGSRSQQAVQASIPAPPQEGVAYPQSSATVSVGTMFTGPRFGIFSQPSTYTTLGFQKLKSCSISMLKLVVRLNPLWPYHP
ncbi:uncharacterized protein LOC120322336 [Drosophila yakuba]|uniref:uncharacterized protein LOC120322336 n=1 Tax=Drosophila yakuba TaxID=7245 RepID=UPI0019308741|nr:uncharacterized protein LOC120322336 [Drosophila yakuba]